MGEQQWRCEIVPGPGFVARWSGGVLAAAGPGAADLIAEVVEGAANSIADTPQRAELINARLDAAIARGTTAAAVLLFAPDGSIVHQAQRGTATVVTDPEPWLAIEPGFTAEPNPILDLSHGVVPGAAVHIRPRGRQATPPRPAASEPTEAADANRAVMEDLGKTTARPLPLLSNRVLGVQCPRGHFNRPGITYCSVCGGSLAHLQAQLVEGPRPSLGTLVADDGSRYELHGSYIIGREPQAVPGTLDALALDHHTVSREHARIDIRDWDIVVTDLGSTNGSFVWNHELQQWQRLGQGVSTVIGPGISLAFGQRIISVEPAA